jgi:hypothetical protein
MVDTRAVIAGKLANTRYSIVNIRLGYLFRVKDQFSMGKTGFGEAPQIQDYLQKLAVVGLLVEWITDMKRQDIKQCV